MATFDSFMAGIKNNHEKTKIKHDLAMSGFLC